MLMYFILVDDGEQMPEATEEDNEVQEADGAQSLPPQVG